MDLSVENNVHAILNHNRFVFERANKTTITFLQWVLAWILIPLGFYIFAPWRIDVDHGRIHDYGLSMRFLSPIVIFLVIAALILLYWLLFYSKEEDGRKISRLVTYLPPIACAMAMAVAIPIAFSGIVDFLSESQKGFADALCIRMNFKVFFEEYPALQLDGFGACFLGLFIAAKWCIASYALQYFRDTTRIDFELAASLFCAVFLPIFAWCMCFVFWTGHSFAMAIASATIIPTIGVFYLVCSKYPQILKVILGFAMAIATPFVAAMWVFFVITGGLKEKG